MTENYLLSPFEHRISALRERVEAATRRAEEASADERAATSKLAEDLHAELELLLAERNIIARDAI